MRQAFIRTLHVGLDDELQHLLPAFAHLVEDVFELGRLLLGEFDVAEFSLAEQRDFARLALVAQHQYIGARRRHVG